MANWTMEWKNAQGATCMAIISGMAAAKTLVPAEMPMSTRTDDDEDFFKKVRGESGYLRSICKAGDLDELFTGTVLSHRLVLRVNGTVVWIGYIKQETWTQPLKDGYVEQEIALVGVLEAMYGVYPDADMGIVGLGQLTRIFLESMGVADVVAQVGVAEKSGYAEFSKYGGHIDTRVWGTEDGRCNATWGEVWEDVCGVYGFAMQLDMSMLCFMRRDENEGRMEIFPVAKLYGDNDVVPSKMPLLPMGLGELGAGHSTSTMQGKKMVRVTGNVGDGGDETLYELKAEDMDVKSREELRYDEDFVHLTRYYTCDFGETVGGIHAMREPYIPPTTVSGPARDKLKSWIAGRDAHLSTINGGGIEVLGWGRGGWVDGEPADWTWLKGISVLPASNRGNATCFYIETDEITTVDANTYMTLSGMVSGLKEWPRYDGSAENAMNMDWKVKVEFGRYWLNPKIEDGAYKVDENWSTAEGDRTLRIRDGRMTALDVKHIEGNSAWREMKDGATVPLPAGVTGKIRIYFKTPTDSATWVAFWVTQLKVEVFRANDMFAKPTASNNKQQTIGDGTLDSYTVEHDLTCARGGQYGYGCLLSYPTMDAHGDTTYGLRGYLYNDIETGEFVRPEEALCARLAAYYGSATKMGKFVVKHVASARAKIADRLKDGKTYVIVAQSMDWRSMKNELTCLELKN